MQNILFLSNCYGEDRSAAIIATELKKLNPDTKVMGAPLISTGEEYGKRGIPLLMKSKIPPSGGFPRTFISLLKDAPYFYIPIRYYIGLKKIRSKITQAMVVGDIFLLVLAWLGLKRKLIFLAPSKSDYQNPHFKFEHWIMRKTCTQVFTHDELTAKNLRKEHIKAEFVGNPMVDELEEIQNSKVKTQNSKLIGILPGSREEAYKNFLKILTIVESLSNIRDDTFFAAAIPPSIDAQKLVATTTRNGWQYVGAIHEFHLLKKNKAKVQLHQNAFIDIITQSDVIIGLAGTANEQAAALGKPIVSFKGCGPQTSLTRIKNQEKLLGGCLKVAEFPDGVVEEVLLLLDNKELSEARGKIGKERMGTRGGAKRIAEFMNKKAYGQ